MKWSHSQAAGGSYLMHTCFACRATSGDNFLYGSIGASSPEPLTSEPVWHMVVCEAGHWEKIAERAWPPNVTVRRPTTGRGLVGEAAGLFARTPRATGVTFQPVNAVNVRALTQRMLGLDHWS